MWKGLSNALILHRLPVPRQRGLFTTPSTEKGQLERGPSQLGKQQGLPGLSPALLGPTATGRS